MVVLAIDYSNFCFYYSFWFAPCKAIWIPESKSFLTVESGIQQTFIVESGILRFGIRNTAQAIRNTAKDWNKNSRFHKQR